MTDKKQKLVLLDGSSYLFRAYHALPPLVTKQNQPTGAIYGVINMIRRLINDEKPDYMAVVFDTKKKTFRHKMYKEYKANRPEMPEDLGCQIKPLHDVIEAMGLPLITAPGYEADDVIGTLAKQAQKQKLRVIISTGDKDLAQLVTPDITLVNTMSNTVLDEDGVVKKFGVSPDQIIDYLSLIGDTSDNIPGIPKVGPKTAAKWLGEYKTLDNIKKHADEFKGKVGEYLRENLDTLDLSKSLVTIDDDVPLEVKPKDLVMGAQDTSKLKTMFETLEFKTWLKALDSTPDKPSAPSKPESEAKYHTVYAESELKKICNAAKKQKLVCFDLETTSLNTIEAEIVGVALALTSNEAYYVPIAHTQSEKPQLSMDVVLSYLAPLLEDDKILKIGQNLKYDIEVLRNVDIQVKGAQFDTMLESYVFNSVATRHDMDSLASYYLNYQTVSYEDLCGKGAKQIPFSEVPIKEASHYAAEDADVTMRLHETLWPKLEEDKKLKHIYEEIEQPLIDVLVSMERTGVKIDDKRLKKQSKELAKQIEALEEQAFALAGEDFNLGSPKQLQAILYEKLELPVLAKTPKGQPSTAESVLQDLSHEYELPKIILEHRSLSKLKSTYTDKLPLVINETTNRVHTSYHQAVTATGRLSSSDPNLQNIPIRTPEGQKIRKAFIPETGKVILAADYSQIELRIMAHLSKDKGLRNAFEHGEDIHRFTAHEMFGVVLEKVTPEQRRSAKAINFGLIYGMSAFGLSKQLDCSRGEAQEYMDTYFERYPGIKTYMEDTREKAAKYGFVETLEGRKLYLPDINSRNVPRKRAAERIAINAPMQGTAADMIKKAMINIYQWLQSEDTGIDMIMQVHDELVFEVPDGEVNTAHQKIKTLMEHACELTVPMVVSVGIGKNWQEAH